MIGKLHSEYEGTGLMDLTRGIGVQYEGTAKNVVGKQEHTLKVKISSKVVPKDP